MKSEFDGTRGGFISVWDVGAKCSRVGGGVGGGRKGGRGGDGVEAYRVGGCQGGLELDFGRNIFK